MKTIIKYIIMQIEEFDGSIFSPQEYVNGHIEHKFDEDGYDSEEEAIKIIEDTIQYGYSSFIILKRIIRSNE